MRIKNTTKQIEQNKYDISVNKENVERLAQDLAKLEIQFDVLWKSVLEAIDTKLASEPNAQTLKCDQCSLFTKDYQIIVQNDYATGVICSYCLQESEENSD